MHLLVALWLTAAPEPVAYDAPLTELKLPLDVPAEADETAAPVAADEAKTRFFEALTAPALAPLKSLSGAGEAKLWLVGTVKVRGKPMLVAHARAGDSAATWLIVLGKARAPLDGFLLSSSEKGATSHSVLRGDGRVDTVRETSRDGEKPAFWDRRITYLAFARGHLVGKPAQHALREFVEKDSGDRVCFVYADGVMNFFFSGGAEDKAHPGVARGDEFTGRFKVTLDDGRKFDVASSLDAKVMTVTAPDGSKRRFELARGK